MAVYNQKQEQNRSFNMIDNYIYLHHTDTLIIIPQYPESVSDTMNVQFNANTVLSRSAPIFAYSHSGPRTLQVKVKLHRDMMTQINWGKSNAKLELGDDYVDTMIKQLQAAAVPRYGASQKMVDPPLVSVRWGTDIFCKGVVNGGVSVDYQAPIIATTNGDKYALVDIAFQIQEVDPYDADTIMQQGGYRGISTSLERNIWKSV